MPHGAAWTDMTSRASRACGKAEGQKVHSAEIISVYKLEFMTFSWDMSFFDNQMKGMNRLPRINQHPAFLQEVPRRPQGDMLLGSLPNPVTFQGACPPKCSPCLTPSPQCPILIGYMVISRTMVPLYQCEWVVHSAQCYDTTQGNGPVREGVNKTFADRAIPKP